MQAGGAGGQRDRRMIAVAIGAGVAFLIIGSVLGWHSHTTYAAHGDIKVAKTRLRGGRRTRWRSAVWVVAIAAAILLVSWDWLSQH
jgi:hypothetical protein